MAKVIGPSFPSELQIAGFLGLPQFDPLMTPAQIVAVLRVWRQGIN